MGFETPPVPKVGLFWLALIHFVPLGLISGGIIGVHGDRCGPDCVGQIYQLGGVSARRGDSAWP
jgi:hypothetical protein